MSTEFDESRDFGNEQEMGVEEKQHPALGPTERSQDVDSLPRHIVPMGAYTDPNNPVAVSGSVNLSLDDHPVTHDPDYGKELHEVYGHDHVENTMSEGSRSLQQFDRSQAEAGAGVEGDREEWSKTDWQKLAKQYQLPTSGSKADLQERVEQYEERQSMSQEDLDAEERAERVEAAKNLKAADWKDEIDAAESVEDLDDLQSLYQESGADFSSVDSAFEAKREALGTNGS